MAQSFFPITPVEVTPVTEDAWTDVDVSAYVPSGATGVILQIYNTVTTSYSINVRKNGSTDDRYTDIYEEQYWAPVGIDTNRIFEAKVQDTTPGGGDYLHILLVGYTISGVTFLTNAVDKSLSALDTWTDIDCSADAPSATGLVFEYYSAQNRNFGMRKNGSTDNRVVQTFARSIRMILGCDNGQIVEGQIDNAFADFFLIAYTTDGAIFNTNATDASLTATSTWTDLSSLPANSVMGFYEVNTSVLASYYFGLRKNGSAQDIYEYARYHCWGVVECDGGLIIEGKISNADMDFFLVGYALEVEYSIGVAPNITTQPCTAIAATTATGNGTIVDLGTTAITQYGHCWATTVNPTTANSKTSLGTGALGTFTSSITSLLEGQKYYIRAYATNSGGTAYGGNVSFTAGKSWSQLESGNLKVKGTTVRYIGFDGVEYYIQGVAV